MGWKLWQCIFLASLVCFMVNMSLHNALQDAAVRRDEAVQREAAPMAAQYGGHWTEAVTAFGEKCYIHIHTNREVSLEWITHIFSRGVGIVLPRVFHPENGPTGSADGQDRPFRVHSTQT